MNDTQTLTLRNDYLFKLLLGSEENKECLQDFLECVLDMQYGTIADLELLDKELTKDTFSDRHPCLSENTSFAIRQNIASAWNHRHPWRY